MKKKDILKELIRGVHMPSFCDEEGRCDAIEECNAIEAKECSCCNINHIVKAFNKGIEYQQQKSPWINVEEDLPCNHEEFIETGSHYLKETIYVITVNKYGIIENNYMVLYDNGKWEWKYGAIPCYWMLIPKLPKEIEIELATK